MADETPVRWQPNRDRPPPPWPNPPLAIAIARGFRGRCPACGKTRLFSSFLRIVPACPACGAPLGRVPIDDTGPVFTIFIVGVVVVGLLVLMETMMHLPGIVEAAILMPLTVVLALVLLHPVKGAALGLMLRLGIVKGEDEP